MPLLSLQSTYVRLLDNELPNPRRILSDSSFDAGHPLDDIPNWLSDKVYNEAVPNHTVRGDFVSESARVQSHRLVTLLNSP